MVYLLQVTLYTTLFWALYRWLGRDRLSPAAARAFLLLSSALPLVLPFLAWRWALEGAVSQSLMSHLPGRLPLQAFDLDGVTVKSSAPFPWATAGYGFVALCLLCSKGWIYLRFARQHMGRGWERYGKARLYRDSGIGPASFANAIFLPDADADPAVIAHEYAHVTGRHTADLVALDVLRAIFWPNIVLRVLFRELKVVHEYAADATAARGVPHYRDLLLGAVGSARTPRLTNGFAQWRLARRLRFLAAPARAPHRPVRLAAGSVAVMAAIILVQSCQKTTTDNRAEMVSMIKDMVDFAYKHPNYKGAATIHGKTVQVNADSFVRDGYVTYSNPDVKAIPPAAFDAVVDAELPGWKKIHLDSVAEGQEYYTVSADIKADGSARVLAGLRQKKTREGFFDDSPIDPAVARILSRSPRWTPAQWHGRAVATSTAFALVKN